MKTIQEWAEHYASMSKTKCMPDAILSVVADAVALEKQFASLIKQDVRQVAYDCDVGVLVVLLNNLRSLESRLKMAKVPAEKVYLQLTARRELAHARSRVATYHTLVSQAYKVPATFDSTVDQASLKALADLATKRLSDLVG